MKKKTLKDLEHLINEVSSRLITVENQIKELKDRDQLYSNNFDYSMKIVHAEQVKRIEFSAFKELITTDVTRLQELYTQIHNIIVHNRNEKKNV